MGNKRNVKKLKMNNQLPSKSSSSFRQKQEMAEIANKQGEKKMKEYSKSEAEDQTQVEVEDKCFIDELPSEMLLKIFKYLDIQSLLDSRLVSRKWNKTAREILQSRVDVEAVFSCGETEGGNLQLDGEAGRVEATLENFIECFEDSKESPLYTRFRFNDTKLALFSDPSWTKFTTAFGKSAKCIKLVIHENEIVDDMTKIAGRLRNLLVNQLPNLQEFGFYFHIPHSFSTHL